MEVQARKNDTLKYYSQLFNIPFILILDSNLDVEDPNVLQVGQAIQIPGYTVSSCIIEEGESLESIAQKHQLNNDALLLLNQHLKHRELNSGNKVIIPEKVTMRVVNGNEQYDFQKLTQDLHRLIAIYPFIRNREAGKSVLGLPLHEIQIGKQKRKVQINASFHANEWITTAILMRFINDFLICITNRMTIKGESPLMIYEHVCLCTIPMVNPDGVNLVLNGPPPDRETELIQLNGGSRDFSGWKANIKGIDLNKQFPANWEFETKRKPKQPGPRDFPGFTALSEPETKTMAALASKENYDRLLALHTQGEEIYWGFEGLEPAESRLLAMDLAKCSGYEAVQYVDNFAGYKDWFIQTFRKPGFTIELGKGTNPLPFSQFEEIYSQMLGLFVRALI